MKHTYLHVDRTELSDGSYGRETSVKEAKLMLKKERLKMLATTFEAEQLCEQHLSFYCPSVEPERIVRYEYFEANTKKYLYNRDFAYAVGVSAELYRLDNNP